MNFISADLIVLDAHNEAYRALISSVRKTNGFFELRHERPYYDVHMSTSDILSNLLRYKGGIVILSSEHKHKKSLHGLAEYQYADGDRHELLFIGHESDFCNECRGEVIKGVVTRYEHFQTCSDCQHAIREGLPIEPRPLSKKFIEVMTAWHTRHGDTEAIERLKALM